MSQSDPSAPAAEAFPSLDLHLDVAEVKEELSLPDPKAEVVDAAEVMGRKRVRHLPVIDRDEELVGLLTVDDLAWQTDYHLLGQVIERIHLAYKSGR